MFNFKKNKENILSSLFFFISLTLGYIFFVGQYGINWDEPLYKGFAETDYNLIKKKIFDNSVSFKEFLRLVENSSLKHPTIFYTIVLLICDILNITETIHIYRLASLLNFSIFIFSCFLFFKIIKLRFKNSLFAYLSILIIFFSPRIISESFYNNRDIFFLSLNLINLYLFQRIFYKINFFSILLLSLSLALCIHVRIFGIINLFLSVAFIFLEYDKKINTNKNIYYILTIIVLTTFFFIIITPYLWSSPFENFFKYYFTNLNVLKNLKIANNFLGDYYSSHNSPWYYYIIWIIFTNPLFFLLLGISGILFQIKFFLSNLLKLKKNDNIWKNKIQLFDAFVLFYLLFTLFILSKSPSKYDGWRHAYFIYPIIILNIFYFFEYLKNKLFKIYFIFLILLFLNFFFNAIWIQKNHPYQFLYFNLLENFLKKNSFDQDYWGLTNLYALKFIEKNDLNNNIKIAAISWTGLEPNFNILKKDTKQKIKIVNIFENPDYIIDNYRSFHKISQNNKLILKKYRKIFEININQNKIVTLYEKLNSK